LREFGSRKDGENQKGEACSNPRAAQPHTQMSDQIPGHIAAAERTNLAPFLI